MLSKINFSNLCCKRAYLIFFTFVIFPIIISCSTHLPLELNEDKIIADELTCQWYLEDQYIILESITFSFEGYQDMIAFISRNDDTYTIEIYNNECYHFQSLDLIGAGVLLPPRNLRILEFDDRTFSNPHITAQIRSPGYYWNLTYDWNSLSERFQRSFINRSLTVTQTNGIILHGNLIVEDGRARVEILDIEFNMIQVIQIENDSLPTIFSSISFGDVNNDGYLDLIVNHGEGRGTHLVFYIWDSFYEYFIEVEFIGFDAFNHPIIEDDHILNFTSDSYNNPLVQMMVWEDSRLILISEEYIRE